MNLFKSKKGQADVESIFGFIALFVLVILFISSITSTDLCNKVLLSIAWFFGIIWLLFGSTFHQKLEVGNLRFTLPLAIIVLVLWLILKLTGVCIPLSELIAQLLP